MKKLSQLSFVIVGLLLLTGCYINKKGHICSLTMPAYFCDKEAREKLMNPGRMVDRWTLNGGTAQTRLQDWTDCGGSSIGDYWLAPLPNGEKRTEQQYTSDARVKIHGIYRCMMKKHYEYTDQCTSSVMIESPPCLARAGKPWE